MANNNCGESPLVQRFLKYVSIWTTSDDSTGTTPSTARQLDMARYLRDELTAMGLEDVSLDENGYVTGLKRGRPAIRVQHD